MRWIKEAVAQYIPLSKPVSVSVPWWSSELTQLVRNARRARRWHKRRLCAEAWRVNLEALNAKGETIRKAKAAQFMHAVAEAARRKKGVWLLATCAKTRSHLPPTPPPITNFVTQIGTATTPDKKADALMAQFFPPMPDADLSDIPNASHPPKMRSPMSISEEEFSSVLKK